MIAIAVFASRSLWVSNVYRICPDYSTLASFSSALFNVVIIIEVIIIVVYIATYCYNSFGKFYRCGGRTTCLYLLLRCSKVRSIFKSFPPTVFPSDLFLSDCVCLRLCFPPTMFPSDYACLRLSLPPTMTTKQTMNGRTADCRRNCYR